MVLLPDKECFRHVGTPAAATEVCLRTARIGYNQQAICQSEWLRTGTRTRKGHATSLPLQVLKTFSDGLSESLVQSTQFRLRGNSAAISGRLEESCELYGRGIDLKPPAGLHLLYSNRSASLLQVLNDFTVLQMQVKEKAVIEQACMAAACEYVLFKDLGGL